MLEKLRKKWWVGALLVPFAVWLALEIRAGVFEGTGWGPRQIAAKVSRWFTDAPAPEKGKVETGSIPAPAHKPDSPSDAQKKEAAARARKARCEKERLTDLMEAEKELAVYDYRANACVAEAKMSIFTPGILSGPARERSTLKGRPKCAGTQLLGGAAEGGRLRKI